MNTINPPTTLDGPNRLLSPEEIDQITGCGERMARRLIEKRRVPSVKIGRTVRVWSHDLAAYLDAQTRPAQPVGLGA